MTFSEMVNELKALGFDYVTQSRLEDWVQRSYQQLDSRYVWPWSEESVESTAPKEIKDLRRILSVVDVNQELDLYGRSRQWIVERFPNLNEEALPLYWFLDNQTLRTYPLSSDKLQIRYVKKAPELELAKEPLWPKEWQYLIIEMAHVFALRDNDSYAEAREVKEEVQSGMQEMIVDQLQRDLQRPPSMVRTDYPWVYL